MKPYETAEIEIILFINADVVTASDDNDTEYEL